MVPLHVHSYYSMLEGTASPAALVERAKASGMQWLPLTDTNGMYGLIQFYKKAVEAKIKPVMGVYIDQPDDPSLYALFIARDREGYSNICEITTARKLKEKFSLFNVVRGGLEHLFVVTPSVELLKAAQAAGQENVFAELIATKRRRSETRAVYEFARSAGIPYVASNPVYFLDEDDFLLHRVVRAMRERTTLRNIAPEQLADPEYYFRGTEELNRIWRALPEAAENTERIARLSSVDLEMGVTKFPNFGVPDGESPFSMLWRLSFEGLHRRYAKLNDKIINRLKYEMDVIEELGFTDYFLVVWDILREAKRRGMMTLGRGSAANSLVSYCLGFTEVDPIKHNLYFERFLNRGRSTPPDIDLDFSWKERDHIVKYVFDKYGYDRTAMISTTITFRARSAFRETAKVFGIADSEISEYSRYIPWTDARNLPEIASMFPESKSLRFRDEPWKTIVTIASRLAGHPRHLSIHPGGIVISPTAITDYTALEYAANKGVGLIITQPDMYPIEDLGLIKIDLLSQRSLGVLRDTVSRIQHQGAGEEPPAAGIRTAV